MLREYLDDFAITYLDDILIYSDDLEMHCSHVHKVLEKLNERALYVKKSKASSKQRKLSFDYIIQFEQIEKNLKDKCSQKLAFAETSQESTSLSKVDELLLKVCT
jgi:predicted transcriptional regulator